MDSLQELHSRKDLGNVPPIPLVLITESLRHQFLFRRNFEPNQAEVDHSEQNLVRYSPDAEGAQKHP
jgi:hypothetical protein